MIHEAFIYRTDAEYAAVLAPFLAEAVEAGQRAVAVTSPARIELLRDALGVAQEAVAFVDASDWYRRPGATLAAWVAELESYTAETPVRAIGEVEFGTDPAAVTRWTRYESLFNRALTERTAWVICPYDARRLPTEVVASAHLTHPVVSSGAGRVPSHGHFDGHELAAPVSPGTARPEARLDDAVAVEPGGDPVVIRRVLTWSARLAGIGEDVLEDLLLAVTELARGFARATVRAGVAGGEWYCEVEGAARAPGSFPLDENGLGILIGRLICDRVEVVHGEAAPLVRFVFGSPTPTPRERILAAAGDLFVEHGIRGSGINAIIERAGVAKATFYAQFASKDELVSAWLQSAPVRWFDGVRAELEARGSSPLERLTLLFDVLAEWFTASRRDARNTFAAAAEARSSDPTRSTLAGLETEIEEYLRTTAQSAGLRDPDAVASQLLVLISGAAGVAMSRSSVDPLASARLVAQRLLAEHS